MYVYIYKCIYLVDYICENLLSNTACKSSNYRFHSGVGAEIIYLTHWKIYRKWCCILVHHVWQLRQCSSINKDKHCSAVFKSCIPLHKFVKVKLNLICSLYFSIEFNLPQFLSNCNRKRTIYFLRNQARRRQWVLCPKELRWKCFRTPMCSSRFRFFGIESWCWLR